jgi:hypothetical protein
VNLVNLELHHFFIFVQTGAEVARLLRSIGMREGTRNIHEGQGTSNRRFNFANGTLELLWIHDEEEAIHGLGRNMFLADRAKDARASPFGVIFTRKDNMSDSMPFEGWKYEPVYLHSSWSFHIGVNSTNLVEPLCVYMPFIEPGTPRGSDENRDIGSISQVKIYVPVNAMSKVLTVANGADRLVIEQGNDHLMEIMFNNHNKGLSKDFRPYIPLIVHW